jgi:protein-disulfide isomerase
VSTGKVRFRYNHFAFIGGANGESVRAAEASECANDQGAFWAYHDKLFAEQGGENVGAYSDANLKRFAAEIGLNTQQFNECYDTRQHAATVLASNRQAEQLKLGGTPTVFLLTPSGQRITVESVLDYPSIKALVNTELARIGVPPAP